MLLFFQSGLWFEQSNFSIGICIFSGMTSLPVEKLAFQICNDIFLENLSKPKFHRSMNLWINGTTDLWIYGPTYTSVGQLKEVNGSMDL